MERARLCCGLPPLALRLPLFHVLKRPLLVRLELVAPPEPACDQVAKPRCVRLVLARLDHVLGNNAVHKLVRDAALRLQVAQAADELVRQQHIRGSLNGLEAAKARALGRLRSVNINEN